MTNEQEIRAAAVLAAATLYSGSRVSTQFLTGDAAPEIESYIRGES